MQRYIFPYIFQVMSMYTIDKMLVRTSVEIACVHPGITDTNLYRNHLPEGHEGCKRGVYSAFGKINIIYSNNSSLKCLFHNVIGKYIC